MKEIKDGKKINDKQTTKKELTKYFNLESVPNIIIGKDSYLTYKLPSELSKKHNLESYEKESIGIYRKINYYSNV